MSLYYDTITDITKKLNKDEQLLFGENIIYNMYMSHFKKIVFYDKSNENINVDGIHNVIQQILLRDKNYIFKLIFSDGNLLYIPINLLIKIDYFKNMIEYYNFNNNCIIEILLCKEIDNYGCMLDIITFVDIGKFKKPNYNFKDFYDICVIVDYLGTVYNNNINILDKLVKCYSSEIITFKNTHNYNGNTFEAFVNIYNILKNNKIDFNISIITYIWGHMTDLDENKDCILKSQIFKNIIMYTGIGMQYLLKYKKYEYFNEILDVNNYDKINVYNKNYGKYANLCDVVDILLKDNTLESYTIVYDNSKINYDEKVNKILQYLNWYPNLLSDIIFNFDISIFKIGTKLKLMIKHDKVEYLEEIAEHIFGNTLRGHYNDLVTYINKHNENHLPIEIKYYPSLINFSPKNNYKIHELLNDEVNYNGRDFYQIINYIPLKYKLWSQIGIVEDFHVVNDKNIGFIFKPNKSRIYFDTIGTNLENDDIIMINKTNNEQYNIMNVDKISNIKNTHLFIVKINEEALLKIKIGDFVYK